MSRNKFNIDLKKVSKKINYKYGLVKEGDPRVVYLNGSGWVKPTIVDETCPKRIEKINRRFQRLVLRHLANNMFFSMNFISDFHIPIDKFVPGKKKFMQFECLFKQTHNMSMEELKDDIERGVKRLTRELENTILENDFQVTKRK